MYDFYPEWGPARHRDHEDAEPSRRTTRHWAKHWADDSRSARAGRADTRDAEGERPDDN